MRCRAEGTIVADGVNVSGTVAEWVLEPQASLRSQAKVVDVWRDDRHRYGTEGIGIGGKVDRVGGIAEIIACHVKSHKLPLQVLVISIVLRTRKSWAALECTHRFSRIALRAAALLPHLAVSKWQQGHRTACHNISETAIHQPCPQYKNVHRPH